MRTEMSEKIPQDLKKLDECLFRLADKAMKNFDSGEAFLNRISKQMEGREPEAKIISVGGRGEPVTAFPPRRIKKRSWPFFLAAAAIFLILFVGLWKGFSPRLGMMEYRSGLTTVIRSGNPLDSSTEKLKSGDVLETRQGNLVALFDKRVQLLMNSQTRVRVQSKSKIRLESGEIWIYVNPGSGEYMVELPRGTVHVVGTSFGVRLDEKEANVTVTTGRVLFQQENQDVSVAAGESLLVSRGGNLSQAEKIKNEGGNLPPEWVKVLINEIAAERLKKFFPSAVPIPSEE